MSTLINKVGLGSIEVDKNVIAEIVTNTINKINGVSSIRPNIIESVLRLFGYENFPGIIVKGFQNNELSLEVKILVHFSAHIPIIGREVQDVIKKELEKALELSVKNIDVNIYGIERGDK